MWHLLPCPVEIDRPASWLFTAEHRRAEPILEANLTKFRLAGGDQAQLAQSRAEIWTIEYGTPDSFSCAIFARIYGLSSRRSVPTTDSAM